VSEPQPGSPHDAALAALGVHRIPIPIPFAAAGGPVNVYAIEERDGRLLLFDAGLGTPEAEAALEAAFARLGRTFADVSRIVVSHGHVDHYGAARWVQERHGGTPPPPVLAHPADHPKISEAGPRWKDGQVRYGAHLARLGVPPDGLAAIAQEGARGFGLARRVAEVGPIGEGDVLETRHLRLEVLHMPGHTPGLVCLVDPARRLVFSDDHLLERISPNPLIELGPDGRDGFFRPLVAYLASVARLRALDVDLVLPGHGPPFSGHRAGIDRLLGFFARRQEKLVALVAEGPRTAYELSRALFPAARPGELFLTVSETVANLEVLEDHGAVARREEDGVFRYRALAAA
jgi:glyoxylase-like metal-dependent hydrolase (beta-lactamase superfamily II)